MTDETRKEPTPEQHAAATRLLGQAKHSFYRLLLASGFAWGTSWAIGTPYLQTLVVTVLFYVALTYGATAAGFNWTIGQFHGNIKNVTEASAAYIGQMPANGASEGAPFPVPPNQGPYL